MKDVINSEVPYNPDKIKDKEVVNSKVPYNPNLLKEIKKAKVY